LPLALPPASPAVEAIVDTLALSPGFCLVLVVGPTSQQTLAEWSLRLRLEPLSQELLLLDLRYAKPDLEGVLGSATTERPVVWIAGLEALPGEERAEVITSMNLLRDEWGRSGVRIVLWCDPQTLDDVWRYAPDLLHWRSLLQPLEPADLTVFDRRSYLAWCVDAFRESTTDRVYAGGRLVAEQTLPIRLVSNPKNQESIDFADWILARGHRVLLCPPTLDPRFPAKGSCRRLAQQLLSGRDELPIPVLVNMREVEMLLERALPLGSTPVVRTLWATIFAEEHIVFVIDDLTSAYTEVYERLVNAALCRVIVVTSDLHRIPPSVEWAKAIVVTIDLNSTRVLSPEVKDPALTGAPGPEKELYELLLVLFSADELRRFIAHHYPQVRDSLPGLSISQAELAFSLTSILGRHGLIDTRFFELLSEMRPRRRADVERVAASFRALGRFA